MIVVDTSVALKWINEQERDRKSAKKIYINHIEGKEEIIVPSLFYIEAANALATKNISSEEDISKGMQFLVNSGLIEYSLTQEDIISAALLAKKYKTSVYDMLYAVIANENNTILITADEKFVKTVKLSYVKLLGRSY